MSNPTYFWDEENEVEVIVPDNDPVVPVNPLEEMDNKETKIQEENNKAMDEIAEKLLSNETLRQGLETFLKERKVSREAYLMLADACPALSKENANQYTSYPSPIGLNQAITDVGDTYLKQYNETMYAIKQRLSGIMDGVSQRDTKIYPLVQALEKLNLVWVNYCQSISQSNDDVFYCNISKEIFDDLNIPKYTNDYLTTKKAYSDLVKLTGFGKIRSDYVKMVLASILTINDAILSRDDEAVASHVDKIKFLRQSLPKYPYNHDEIIDITQTKQDVDELFFHVDQHLDTNPKPYNPFLDIVDKADLTEFPNVIENAQDIVQFNHAEITKLVDAIISVNELIKDSTKDIYKDTDVYHLYQSVLDVHMDLVSRLNNLIYLNRKASYYLQRYFVEVILVYVEVAKSLDNIAKRYKNDTHYLASLYTEIHKAVEETIRYADEYLKK